MTAAATLPQSLHAHHVDGLLVLRLRRDPTGRTALVGRRQRFPLRTTVALYLDDGDRGMAFVYVQNPSGGVFAGDRLSVEVHAEAGTRVHLTSQSATKLCRSGIDAPAVQELRIHAGEGAYVEHIPDPLIPHPGAKYRQRTTVELAAGASFVNAETIAPGRLGERYAYEEIELRTIVHHAGEELCVDALRLARGMGAHPGVLGARCWHATLLAVSPGRDGEKLAARIDDVLTVEPGVLAVAGALPYGAGAVVRIIADGAVLARRALMRAWAETRLEWLSLPLPPVRK